MQDQYMMADPQLLGAQYQLGNHQATYGQTRNQFMTCMVMCVIVVIGGILVSFWAFTSLPSNGCLGVGALLVAIVSLLLLSGVYQDRVKRVFVYDDGLIHVGQKFRQTVIYWRDVQSIVHQVTTGENSTSHTYTVNYADGKSLKLNGTFGNEQLGRSIEEATARHIFPIALSAYQMNQTVAFGPLTLTPQGLYHGPKLLSWDELKSIQINTDIVIKKNGKRFTWASVQMVRVPNVEVFRMLIQHITGVRP